MTIGEAIAQAKTLTGSGSLVEDELLCQYLSELDGQIVLDFAGGSEWVSYKLPDDEDALLIVPHPYDGLYVHWLEGKIYYANGEYDRYSNAMAACNKAMLEYRKWVNRSQVRSAEYHTEDGRSVIVFEEGGRP